jgi:hypothetical protein
MKLLAGPGSRFNNARVEFSPMSRPRKVKLVPPSERAFAKQLTAVQLTAEDRREGVWTKLTLIRMDAQFCRAVTHAHPELLTAPVESEQRKRA